jgi:hypothetical protein
LHSHTGVLILVHFRDEFVQFGVLHKLQNCFFFIISQVVNRFYGDFDAVRTMVNIKISSLPSAG